LSPSGNKVSGMYRERSDDKATAAENVHELATHVGRRRVLALTAGTGLLVAAGRTTRLARAQADEPLVGSWMVAATGAGAPLRVLASFLTDGVAIRTAPLRQAAPSGLGVARMFISTTHGAWTRVGDTQFGVTFVGFAFDEAGNFLATQRIRAMLEVNETGDTFTGSARGEFVGADGNVVASVNSAVQGSRIVVEATV